jgi:hypothetical protein
MINNRDYIEEPIETVAPIKSITLASNPIKAQTPLKTKV